MIGLTPKQAECLAFLKDYIAKSGGIGPTFSELEEGFGVCRGRVHAILTSLEERGFIRRMLNRARAIEVVERPDLERMTTFALRELSDQIDAILRRRAAGVAA